MTIKVALRVSVILATFHCKQHHPIVRTMPRRHLDCEDVKVDRESVGDRAEGVVAVASYIRLLGQRLHVCGILLTLPCGQRDGLRGLHPLGMRSKLGAFGKGLYVERDHPLRNDLVVVGQGRGGSITHAHRGLQLRGALRGRKPTKWIQGSGRGGRQMSRRRATVPHLERVWEGVSIHLY